MSSENNTFQADLPTRSAVKPEDPQLNNSLTFGPRMLQHFTFDPEYRNMNNGSFGAAPLAIQQKLHHYQHLSESQPDPFIRYTLPNLIDDSRAAVAQLLHAPVETIVLVPNATVATSAILLNLTWNPDRLDEILSFSTLYGATGRNIDFILASQQDRGGVTSREIPLTYSPYLSAAEILARLRRAISECRASGRRPRLCILDTVSSLPAVRLPFEAIVAECRSQGIQTLVDGAQGVGMLPDLNLTELDPDFFLTNCHKWLHVPRGCAALYVPPRNQPLMRTTVPTSHGYVPAWEDDEEDGGAAMAGEKKKKRVNPLPPSGKSRFVQNFQFTGTMDQGPMFCVRDAIEWRKKVCGGEERITGYVNWLAREGGKKAAEVLGTGEVLGEKPKGRRRNGEEEKEDGGDDDGEYKGCGMTNVRLPIWFGEKGEEEERKEGEPVLGKEDEGLVKHWMGTVMTNEFKTWMPVFSHGGKFWARISSQVWLDVDDFEWAGKVLLELCQRAAKGEFREEK